MSAPPKPWELARSQSLINPSNTSLSASQGQSNLSQSVTSLNTSSTANNSLSNTTNSTSSLMNSPYRRSMMNSPYGRSSMMGLGMGGGLGGMYGMGGMGMYGMGGMGMYGGMQGYGTPSKGMIAIERFSMLVNSLCFTAETIENSMNSMKVFWETIVRIKSWGAGGILAVQKMLHDKLSYFVHYFLYLIGKGEKPNSKDGVSLKSLVLNLAVIYILLLGLKFCWGEFTKPNEEIIEDLDTF